jgi:agmatinase
MGYEEAWERAAKIAQDMAPCTGRRMKRIIRGDTPSFAECDIARHPQDLEGADVAIVGFPYQGVKTLDPHTLLPDQASVPRGSIYCRGGAELAPEYVRKYSIFYSLSEGGGPVPEVDRGLRIADWLAVRDYGDVDIVSGDVEATNANTVSRVGEVFRAGAVPVVIGGDHEVSTPVFQALTRARQGSVGVVVFDSHFDMHSEPRFWAGSQWARAFETGRLEPGNFVQIGIRGTRHPLSEPIVAQELGYRYFTMSEVDEMGITAVCEEALERMEGVDCLYLSLDVDIIDPAFCPGQRYPDVGGLTSREILKALRILSRYGFTAMDTACLSPLYDLNGISCQLVARCVIEVLAGLAQARRLDRVRF